MDFEGWRCSACVRGWRAPSDFDPAWRAGARLGLVRSRQLRVRVFGVDELEIQAGVAKGASVLMMGRELWEAWARKAEGWQ